MLNSHFMEAISDILELKGTKLELVGSKGLWAEIDNLKVSKSCQLNCFEILHGFSRRC